MVHIKTIYGNKIIYNKTIIKSKEKTIIKNAQLKNVQLKRSNSFEAFTPIFNNAFSSLILIGSLYNKTFQFLWESIIQILFLTILMVITRWSGVVMSPSNDVFKNIRFLICLIPSHSFIWALTALSLSLQACSMQHSCNVHCVFPT